MVTYEKVHYMSLVIGEACVKKYAQKYFNASLNHNECIVMDYNKGFIIVSYVNIKYFSCKAAMERTRKK